MVVTKKFIFIHLPKTGGTFVTSKLTEVHEKRYREKNIFSKYLYRIKNKYFIPEFKKLFIKKTNLFSVTYGQHGGCNEIPDRFKQLPIISPFRNPFDRYVSLYKYEWWKRNPFFDISDIKSSFPNYPDLSFREYFDLENNALKLLIPKLDNPPFGLLSWQFIRFFFKDPYIAAKDPNLINLSKENLTSMMYPVEFIYSESLNENLYEILKKYNYPEKFISGIKNAEKILPPKSKRKDTDTWEKYIDLSMKKTILEKEKILFTLFPQYTNKITL